MILIELDFLRRIYSVVALFVVKYLPNMLHPLL